MLFNSYEFIFLFLPISFFIYFYFYFLHKRLTTRAKCFLVFASLLVYGIAIGKYNIFPYKQIVWIKSTIIGKSKFYPYEHYKDRIELFKLSNPRYPIVMLGDSITERGNWNELLGQSNILNRELAVIQQLVY